MSGNAYVDSIDENKKEQIIKPQDTFSKVKEDIEKNNIKIGKDIIEQNLVYFRGKLADMISKNTNEINVTKNEIEMMIRNAEKYLQHVTTKP